MTIAELEHFRNLLLEREQNISHWLHSAEFVNPDDARKAEGLLSQIRDALGRVDRQTFGECEVCHESVEMYRLEVQPVREVCLGCITKEEQAQLEYELFLASKIHRALLPQSVGKIDGFEVAVRSLAARVVGGDYYDFLTGKDNRVSRIIIADVMGKGIPAGLLMSNVQGALRILSEEIETPSRLVSRLNRWLCRNVPVTKFVSLACVALDNISVDKSRLRITNAGHCPPIVLRANASIEEIAPTGGVIGVHEDFEYEECVVDLHSGDSLVLYTDGVTETVDCSDDMFGEERLREYLRSVPNFPADTILQGLVERVQQFSGKAEFDDDLTVIALCKT